MNNLAALAPFLWWLMLLTSTAIILHDLAGKAFSGKPYTASPNKPTRRQTNAPPTTGESIMISIEISSTGFQREAAEAILSVALSARGSPLMKIPETKRDMIDQLFSDTELREFVQANSKQTPRLIDKRTLKQELERTDRMLQNAEMQFK